MRCSELSADEPLAGTAPEAKGFVLLEHPGPWGAKALAEAGHGELEAACKALGLRALLVRRADRAPLPSRTLVAWCGPEPYLAAVDAESVDELLEPLAAGERVGGVLESRLWLVCTNGKRDTCCARAGVPVARALARVAPATTLECSHLGGHRFAANALLLPEGLCFGRLDAASALDLAARLESGELPIDRLRGRTCLEPAAQVAEIAARQVLGDTRLEPLPVTLAGDRALAGGVELALERELLPPRPISCDAEPEPVTVWHATPVGRA